MATSPRILTFRIKTAEDGTSVFVEFGTVELERKIPENQGVQRVSIIFDASGKLDDVEIVTSKIES
jgi:hypothetical protein